MIGHVVVRQFRDSILECFVSRIRHLLGRHRDRMVFLELLVSRHRCGTFCEEVSPRLWAATIFDRWIEDVGGFLRNFRPQMLQGGSNLDFDRPPGYLGDDVDRSVTIAGIIAAVYY